MTTKPRTPEEIAYSIFDAIDCPHDMFAAPRECRLCIASAIREACDVAVREERAAIVKLCEARSAELNREISEFRKVGASGCAFTANDLRTGVLQIATMISARSEKEKA